MTVEEMLKLIDAGFTAAEIKEMRQAPAEPVEPAEPAPAQEAEPDPLAGIMAELKELKKAVFAVNVMTSTQPEQKSVDEVLEKIMKGGH